MNCTESLMTTYTIERAEYNEYDGELVRYILEMSPQLSELFGGALDFRATDYKYLLTECNFMVCKKDGKIVGHLISHLGGTPLDKNIKILRAISFHVRPNNSRAAYLLFNNFIDIGKDQANHIITALTSHSNIKPQTLEKYGFKELETLYRMEIK